MFATPWSSSRNWEKAGAVGDVSCFSFYYAHHMSTIEVVWFAQMMSPLMNH